MAIRPIKPINDPRVRTRKAPEPKEEVGYGKPPKHSRFKPGQSGNPKGRPKGAKSQKTIVFETLLTPIDYVENGVRRKASRLELIFKRMVEKALKGDLRAAERLISMYATLEEGDRQTDAASPASEIDIEAEDEAILKEARELLSKKGDRHE
tara:strand:+ start:1093 stop:1548 length:456 start_codon:yes stop_codon:yes gene_type:complete